MSYVNRLERISELISEAAPPPARIIDWGCAQGNMSLRLAEMGYAVVAADLRLDFLLYSREKYERGRVGWIVGNLEESCFRAECCDVVLLCEVLEHCAYPEAILEACARSLREGGICVVTTPNAEYMRNRLPSFRTIQKGGRNLLAQKQFGPDGADHLFLFTAEELEGITPADLRVQSSGYIGSILLSDRLAKCLKGLSVRNIQRVVGALEKKKSVARRFAAGLYCVYRKCPGSLRNSE